MSEYRRAKVEGGLFFFTVTIADRSTDLLVRHVERLRSAYAAALRRDPFETIAICVLPDHLHAIWALPEDDADFSRRWSLIKHDFSCGLPANPERTPSKRGKREKGIWQRRYWEHAIRDGPTSRVTSTIFISIRSNTGSSRAPVIGRTARSTDMSRADFCRAIGAAKCGQRAVDFSGNPRRVG
jgi:REP element-mobilizing transposase RayT